MKINGSFWAIAALSCSSVIVPTAAKADEWNKETRFTFSRDVAIPGKVLPSGTYVFRLADSPSDRHIVQVFDQAGRIVTTLLAVPAGRATAVDDTRITFDERPASAPPPIKTWFYPGGVVGEEFIYPGRADGGLID
jgi:hypothetical protein